jgi:predicted nucleic acid-binding protein
MVVEYVLDASAALEALLGCGDRAVELVELLHNAELHAPHLVDAEVGDVLRRKVLAGEVGEAAASAAVWTLDAVVEQRYPHAGVLVRSAWDLRHRVRFYDGLYVALAARLRIPLLTADARLSRAPDLPCQIELV